MIHMAVVLVAGFVMGFYVELCITRRSRKNRRKKKVSLDTYAKLVTTVVIVHGMILTTWSYVLAGFGLDPVVDVSSTIVREIVAPVIVYLATNMVMNIFEKNELSFSVPINSTLIRKGKNEEHMLEEAEEQEDFYVD